MEKINIYTHGVEQQGLIETPEEHKIKEARRHKIYQQVHKEELAIQKKQYCEDNKEELAIKKKKYYEENKEKIKEHAKTYGKTITQCLNCGASISNHCMTVHRRTKKCQSFIKEQ